MSSQRTHALMTLHNNNNTNNANGNHTAISTTSVPLPFPSVECLVVHTRDSVLRDKPAATVIVSEPNLLQNARARREGSVFGGNNNNNNGNGTRASLTNAINNAAKSASSSTAANGQTPAAVKGGVPAASNATINKDAANSKTNTTANANATATMSNTTTGTTLNLTSSTSRSLSPAAVPLHQLMRKALGSLLADAEAKTLFYLPEGNLVVRHTVGIDGYFTNNQQACVEELYGKSISHKVRAMFDDPTNTPPPLPPTSLQQSSSSTAGHPLAPQSSLNFVSAALSGAKQSGGGNGSKSNEGIMSQGRSPSTATTTTSSPMRAAAKRSYRQNQLLNHTPTPSTNTRDAVVIIGGHAGRRRRNLLFGTTLSESRHLPGPMDVPGTNVPPKSTWGLLMHSFEAILKGVEEKRFIKDGVQLNGYRATVQAFKLQGTAIIESLVPMNGLTIVPTSGASPASPSSQQYSSSSSMSGVGQQNSGGGGAIRAKRTTSNASSADGDATKSQSYKAPAGVDSRAMHVFRTASKKGAETDAEKEGEEDGAAAASTDATAAVGSPTADAGASSVAAAAGGKDNTNATDANTTNNHKAPSRSRQASLSKAVPDVAAIADLRGQYARLISIANGAILEAEESRDDGEVGGGGVAGKGRASSSSATSSPSSPKRASHVPPHYEVVDGIQLDLKSMGDAVHITNCLEAMFNVSGGGSSNNAFSTNSPSTPSAPSPAFPLNASRALPFHVLVTVKLTSIVKHRNGHQKSHRHGGNGDGSGDGGVLSSREEDDDENDNDDGLEELGPSEQIIRAANAKPTALNECYAEIRREVGADLVGAGGGLSGAGGGGRVGGGFGSNAIDGPPPAITTLQATDSELANLYRKNMDKRSAVYKKSLEEVELASEPAMQPLPTRYFHLVELGDLDWAAPEGSQHLPSDEMAFKKELQHFGMMLRHIREMEALREKDRRASSLSAASSGEGGFESGGGGGNDPFDVIGGVGVTIKSSDNPFNGGGGGNALNSDAAEDEDFSPAPGLRRASTSNALVPSKSVGDGGGGGFSLSPSASSTIYHHHGNNNENRVSESPARRYAKLHSLQLVAFNHALRQTNLSRLIFSNIDPTHCAIAFLANATFSKARSLMQYISLIRNEPIQISLEGPNGEGRENIDEELRNRIFTSQSEAVAQWRLGAQLRTRLRDVTTTLEEKTEECERSEQRLATLKRVSTVTASALGGGGRGGINQPSTANNADSNLRRRSSSVASSSAHTENSTTNLSSTSANLNVDDSVIGGKVYGETLQERNMRHLRLKCQTLKQTYDECVSALKRAKVEGSVATTQLRDIIAHYQAEITRGDDEVASLRAAISSMDAALRTKRSAASAMLAKEIAGNLMYYRRCRQVEEEILQLQREQRAVHNEINHLRAELNHFYSEEQLAAADIKHLRTTAGAEAAADSSNKKNGKSNNSKSNANAKGGSSTKASPAAATGAGVVSQRRMEANAMTSQIQYLEERMHSLQARLKELKETNISVEEFLPEKDDDPYRELNATAVSAITKSGGGSPLSPSQHRPPPINAAKQSLAQLSQVTRTPTNLAVSHDAIQASRQINAETASIRRNTQLNVEAARRVTDTMKQSTEEANRATFDAMTDIKAFLQFIKVFEEIDHSEAKTFFKSVCPKTDCHTDGIFQNSILSSEDLWSFPEQIAANRERRRLLGLSPGGKHSSSTTSIDANSSNASSAVVATSASPLSSHHSLTDPNAFGGDREAQKKSLQKANHDLIQETVNTYVNPVVLDRCEAWTRFFDQNWHTRVNPSVILKAISSAQGKGGWGGGGSDGSRPSSASIPKRVITAHRTDDSGGATSAAAAGSVEVILDHDPQSFRQHRTSVFVGRAGGQFSIHDNSKSKKQIGDNSSAADADQTTNSLNSTQRPQSATPTRTKTIAVSDFETETPFQRFLAAESAKSREGLVREGRRVQREVEASIMKRVTATKTAPHQQQQKATATPATGPAPATAIASVANFDKSSSFRSVVSSFSSAAGDNAFGFRKHSISATAPAANRFTAAAATTKADDDGLNNDSGGGDGALNAAGVGGEQQQQQQPDKTRRSVSIVSITGNPNTTAPTRDANGMLIPKKRVSASSLLSRPSSASILKGKKF